MYKVSLGIPIYNSAAYVERALLSALNQTLPDIEYIIVDDRGTDNSMDIVRRVIAEHPRGKDVRIIVQEVNGGPGVARDTMIANAMAPYIYFMDSDDELPEDAIALLYDTMVQSGGAQVVQGNYVAVPMGGCRPERVDRGGNAIYIIGAKIVQSYPIYFYPIVWNKLYDLDFLKKEQIHFGDLRWSEDVYFSMQVACKARLFVYVPYVTYIYYEIPTSLSMCFREHRYDDTRCRNNKLIYGKLLEWGITLEGDVRLSFEQKILEMLYLENRYVIQSFGMTGDEKKKFIGELDALWHTYPFKGKYRSCKT